MALTGISWEMLPQEMGCGSGVTCWRRLRDWQQAGVWDGLHRELLRHLRHADRIDWSRARMDNCSTAAKKGVLRSAQTPQIEVDRASSVT
jgi:transposase